MRSVVGGWRSDQIKKTESRLFRKTIFGYMVCPFWQSKLMDRPYTTVSVAQSYICCARVTIFFRYRTVQYHTNQFGYEMMASSCTPVQGWHLGVEPSMIEGDNRLVMVIIPLFRLVFKNNLGDPCDCAKIVRFGGFRLPC